MEHQSGCLICGAELVYVQHNELFTCYYCGNQFEANACCTNGHFVCDQCHSLTANDLIEQFCIHTTETDPLALAAALMKNPALKMHGPEHHFLVPAVLLTAYYNQYEPAAKAEAVKQARKRAGLVKGGFCGYYGSCGAGVGAGIFVSILTGATPLTKLEWKYSNRVTGECLLQIADHGGPRCCKRDTYLTLLTTRAFVKQNFDIDIQMADHVLCEFSAMNKECLHHECPFYKQELVVK